MGFCLFNAFLKWNHGICGSLKLTCLTRFSLGFKVCVLNLHWHHILPFVWYWLLIKGLHFTSLQVSSRGSPSQVSSPTLAIYIFL